MDCQDLERFLQPFVDGEFEGEEAVGFEAHLVECASCRGAVGEQRALKRKLREAGRAACALNPPPPPGLRARVLSGLHEQEAARRPFWQRPALAYAAVLTVVAGSGVYYLRVGTARDRAGVYASAAIANHRRHLPLEVQDGQPVGIQRWLRGKVDFAPQVPQLRKVSLIGARLSNLSDRPAAYIAYGASGDRRVSLFVFDAPDLEVRGGRRVNNREVLFSNQHGYNVVLWKEREIAYSLVSDLDERDILELVSAGRQ